MMSASLGTELILSFEKNRKLVDLLTDVMSFGARNKMDKGKQNEQIGPIGKHMESRREVNVKMDGDRNRHWITGCAVMPNGSIVICDRDNDRLKLFDKAWVCQGSLEIPDIFDISVIDVNNVIVTAPNQEKLQYVQILPQLRLGRTIQLDSECWGICVSGDNMYVTYKTSSNRHGIRVLGLDGTKRNRVPVDRNSSPFAITSSPNGEKLFFTDWNTDIVTCITVDGRIVYKYKAGLLTCPRGMFCDSEDTLFVCGFDSKTVQVIAADGKSGSTILTSLDGLQYLHCIAYRSSDDDLIIGQYNGISSLLVYKMKMVYRK